LPFQTERIPQIIAALSKLQVSKKSFNIGNRTNRFMLFGYLKLKGSQANL